VGDKKTVRHDFDARAARQLERTASELRAEGPAFKLRRDFGVHKPQHLR
jgi:hypothetical protein